MQLLETARLSLEYFDENYFEELAHLLANKEIHKLWPEPKTRNREESRKYLDKILSQYEKYGYSYWAIIRKSDSAFIGMCGLLPEEVNGKKEVEVAYRIDNKYWGNGYAPEAAKAVMEYAREQLGWSSVISLILPENHQSIRVAEKNGLIPDGKKNHVGKEHSIYRKRF